MRILVLPDIHGNADALRSVLEHASKYDAVWVLGDLVDYGPEPHVVVDIIRELKPEVLLMGNHDYAVAFNTDCGCGIELHDLSIYTRQRVSHNLLSKEQISWLKTLKLKVVYETSDRKFYLVHGAPSSPLYGYLKPTLPQSVIESMLYEQTTNTFQLKPRLINADYLVVGHTHIPFHMIVRDIKIFNPGSVGQPRDGDPRASYGILDTETLSLTIYRVEYDVEKTVLKLRSLGLDESALRRLALILKTGKVV